MGCDPTNSHISITWQKCVQTHIPYDPPGKTGFGIKFHQLIAWWLARLCGREPRLPLVSQQPSVAYSPLVLQALKSTVRRGTWYSPLSWNKGWSEFSALTERRVCQGLLELPITSEREGDVAPSKEFSHRYFRPPLDPKISPPVSAPFVLQS